MGLLVSVRLVRRVSSHHQPFAADVPPYVGEPAVDEEPRPLVGGVVGAGITYVVVRLRSRALWATSHRNIVRGRSSSRDPVDDVW